MDIQFRIWDKVHKRMITDIVRMHFRNEVLYAVLTNEDELIFSNDFELMQFTGLKDKNNKKIFDGDRVSLWYEELFFKGAVIGEIEWDSGSAQWTISFQREGTYMALASVDLSFSEIEVVGHIYDGKEWDET